MVFLSFTRNKAFAVIKNVSFAIMSKSSKSVIAAKCKINCAGNDNLIHSSNSPAAENVNFQVLPVPIKSESDKKEYKVIRLPNGLTACLISDKSPIKPSEESESESESEVSSEANSDAESGDTEATEDEENLPKAGAEQKMAAAGLCIGVGSFSDPKDVPGMAHFLEHMVFMGSEKFPQENDFDAFIKKNGGSDNASTDVETTCFYFECLEKHLLDALDKFAQFFISPLMKRDAMTREREAVESEFQMAVSSDGSRKEQLLCSFANEVSPVNCFAWGNLITLKDSVSEDELYKGVHEFRKRHYSAHRMTLAIQARLPTEDLEKYVLQCFSDVPNNTTPGDDFSKFVETVFETPAFNRLYYIKPIKDLCQIDLTWALPSLKSKYKSKPHHYISYLLGDEGKGSLLSYLKKKVWALGTSIGNGESGIEHNSLYTFFTVTMVLTKQGLSHTVETIEAVFAYINMLKKLGPQERIFKEVQDISNTSFKFSPEERAVDFVEDVCESMQSYPPEDYIAGSELYYEYDPEAIKMVLDKITPERVNIMIISRDLPVNFKFDKKEKWFGTEYTDRDISNEWLDKWRNVKPYLEMNIPPPNSYITKDFTILPEQSNNPDYPVKVLDTSFVELWYRQDQKFKLPIAYYYFYLISPLSIQSAKNACMLDMMVNLLVIDIAEEIYPATSADLSHEFAAFEKGLVIKVHGFNEKLPTLIGIITKYLNSLSDHITDDMFTAVKDKLLKNYYNKLLKPSGLAKDIRLNLLVNDHWNPADKYSAMLEMTSSDIKSFVKDYLQTLYVKCLVQGNITQETAKNVVNDFVGNLQFSELKKEHYPRFNVVKVSKGEKCCRIMNFNTSDCNSIITNYYQSDQFTLKNSVILELIVLIIEEPLFDILRTKEQLGYHVYCSIRDTYGVLGYTVTVNAQATKNTTQHVDQRIENFLKHTQELLSTMDDEEFNKIKINLMKTKQCTDVHLKEEVDRNWSEITSENYTFDRLKQEIDIIGKTQLDEVRSWWVKHNAFGDKENFRKLGIQVVGHQKKENDDTCHPIPTGNKININCVGNENDAKTENQSEDYFVRNIDEYRQSLSIISIALK